MSAVLVCLCIVLLLALAGFSKSISDTLHHHWSVSVFSKFGTESYWGINSWVIKHRFKGFLQILFSTILVALTDGWHTFNLVRRLSYYAAGGVAMAYFSDFSNERIGIAMGVLWVIESAVFHYFYHKVLLKKTETSS